MVTSVEGDPKAPFSITTTARCREGCYSIPRIATSSKYFYFHTYIYIYIYIMVV